MSDRKNPLVIYHANCTDGFTAAWVAWLKYGDAAEYVPAKYGDAPPDVAGRDVLIVDFSYSRAVIEAMCGSATSITIFDHHKTAKEDLQAMANLTHRIPPFLRIVFDMDRSGAGIAWDELHKHNPPAVPVPGLTQSVYERPWLVDYVEDRDLWRFKLPDSKEVNEFLGVQEHTFTRWRELCALEHLSTAEWHGKTLLQATASYVETMKEHARMGTLQCNQPNAEAPLWFPSFAGEVPIVNCPPTHASDLIGALASGPGVPFAVGWFQRGDGVYQYSLRSRGEGGADVSAIAKAFGGGGHRNAAGFESKERVDV